MARMGLRRLILMTLAAWARNCQNGPQKAHFEHFGGLGPDLARMGLRSLILSTLGLLGWIWASMARCEPAGLDLRLQC